MAVEDETGAGAEPGPPPAGGPAADPGGLAAEGPGSVAGDGPGSVAGDGRGSVAGEAGAGSFAADGPGSVAGDGPGSLAAEAGAGSFAAEAAPDAEPTSGAPAGRRRKKLSPEEEVRAWLGDEVRSPGQIPRDYKPGEASRHPMFRVELTDFAGPLDLLLHLIREHRLDVFDIPIAFIVEKYLAMLDAMAELPIDVAAEFLVMAAELTHIKSKMLLPAKEGVPVEAAEEQGDPRADLVRRLLEYQKYREAADHLEKSGVLGRDVFARQPPPDPSLTEVEPGLGELSIFRLVEAMADVLSRLTPEKQHEVVADTVNITERIQFILDFGQARGDRFPFLDLFAGMESRRVVVMSFLAILEMARTQMLKIEQEGPASVADGAGGVADRAALEPSLGTPEVPAADVPVGPADVPVGPADGAASPADGAASPADVPASPADVPVGPADGAAVPTDVAAVPAEVPASPADGAGSPAVGNGSPADERPARSPGAAASESLEAVYEAAMLELEEPAPRRFRFAEELPPLRAPTPGAIMLVLTGRKLEEVPDAGSGLEPSRLPEGAR